MFMVWMKEKIRELSLEKSSIFEEQKSGALDKMVVINEEIDGLMKKAVEDLQKLDLKSLLENLQQKIFTCYDTESNAFEKLNSIIVPGNLECGLSTPGS